MKKLIFPAVLLLLVAALAFAGFETEKQMHAKKGLAVVELFTSEGCSSCPSADRTVAALRNKKMEDVYILAYHVDYWDRLGWKDRFSSPEYSQRQRKYASALNLNTVYTPQVIVNGSTEFVGSDGNKLASAIQNNLATETGNSLSVTFEKKDNEIRISYAVSGNEEVLLNLAIVQPEATTEVKRGENGGKTLHHVNIVRVLKTITARGSGNTSLAIPRELADIPLSLVSFTQDKKTMRVLAGGQKII